MSITEIDYLKVDIDQIPQPQFSSLLFLWDILAKVDQENKTNKMDINKLSVIFSPLMYKDDDEERNTQILEHLTKFFKVGIEWRIESISQEY